MKSTIGKALKIAILLLIISSIFGCERCTRGGTKGTSSPINRDTDSIQFTHAPVTYNFYIENSGSMKGYFSGRGTSGLESLISQYYDRLTENDFEGDTVTLNYINTSIVSSSEDSRTYLKSAKSKCTASYTKIDDILKMSMKDVDSSKVNIVISDYCFESDFGNLEMARSQITKLFTQQINENNALSVAIIKYMVDFDGNYFPGSIRCKQPMPIYFWIFGNACQVKKISNLQIKQNNCGVVLLQTTQTFDVDIKMKNARAINKEKQIIVDQWKKERNTNLYYANVIVNLSNSIICDSNLTNKDSYIVESSSSSNYKIDSIIKQGEDYTFRIQTDKPSPGEISISFPLVLPKWVENYSFEGNGLPPDSTTYGIKDLIGGVFDAYSQKSKKYFVFNITLK